MIEGIRLQDLIRFSLDPNTIEIKEGEKLPLSVLKQLDNGLFLVNIKGKILTAQFQSLPQLGRFTAEVVKTEPYLELRLLVRESDINEKILKTKGELVKFDKKVMVEILNRYGLRFDPKEVTSDQIKKMIRNSGIFFENKLVRGEEIKDDLKYIFHQKNDNEALGQLNRLQIINILAGVELYLPIKSDEQDIDDLEIFVKKDTNTGIVIKTHFSKIGDVLIYVREMGYEVVDCVVKSEVDISEDLKKVSLEGLRITWKKLEKNEFNNINPIKDALEQLGSFEVLA